MGVTMKARWLITLAFASFAGAGVRSDNKPGDKENIQGSWRIVSLEGNEVPATAEMLKRAKVVFTATKVTFWFAGEKEESSYKLDPSKNPKHFDLVTGEITLLGIYLLEGDNLKLCYSASAKAGRPTKFSSNVDMPVFVLIREMKKP
jgi:uncharacterized protein (TIGR03067 family)